MRSYMKHFCDWAAETLKDGRRRSASQLLSEYEGSGKRYISGSAVVSHALRIDRRFERVRSSSADEWYLKASGP
jgi:hypothetical protein